MMDEKIIIDPSKAEANVYYDFVNRKNQRVYLVKVTFKDAGLYINSITVQPSSKDPTKPWVQSPRYFVRGNWVWPVQMERTKLLWPTIQRLALEAVAEHSKRNAETFDMESGGPFIESESRFL